MNDLENWSETWDESNLYQVQGHARKSSVLAINTSIGNNQRGRKPEGGGDSLMMMNYQYNSDMRESDCTPGFYQARYFEKMQKTIKITYKALVRSSRSVPRLKNMNSR